MKSLQCRQPRRSPGRSDARLLSEAGLLFLVTADLSRLSERYAAGEINEAEYRERLAVLREKK